MAMTKNIPTEVMPGDSCLAYPAAAGVTYYLGALVGVDTDTGELALWADDSTIIFLGFVNSTIGDDGVSVNVAGNIVRNRTVSGVVNQAQVGDLVYADDDGPDFTLTPTTNVDAVGVLYNATGTDTGDVCLFTPKEYVTL